MFNQNQDNSVEKREIRRLLLMASECGIRQESIGIPLQKIDEYLDADFYTNLGILSVTLASDFIYSAKKYWLNKGIFLLVEGGTKDKREFISEMIMFRFLVYNAISSGNPICSERMSAITTMLSTFTQNRFPFSEKLQKAPLLYIQEVDASEAPRNSNDCIPMLDSILFGRIKNYTPTIISLSVPSERFSTPGQFGKCFSEIIQTQDKNKVFRIRLINGK